jgi:ABC-type antimicrobial peptide transport system permease subunit
VSLQDARYKTAAQVNRLFDAGLDALRRAPGVEAAAVSLELPYKRLLNSVFQFADEPPNPDVHPIANWMYVTPGFFDTFKIPVRSGRVMSDLDRTGAPLVAVVNETFVRSWAKGVDPVGRYLAGDPRRQIIGVVGDVQGSNSGIGFPGRTSGPLMTTPTIYVPAAQASDGFMKMSHTWFSPVWSVRAASYVNVEQVLRQAIGSADPLLPLGVVRSMSTVQAAATADRRLLMILIGVLAGAALLLAAIGIHGLIANAVVERTRELGIRIALGAPIGPTISRVAIPGVVLSFVGAVAGLGLSMPAVSLVQVFLWRVSDRDPVTYVAVPLFFVVVAAIASVLPALKILRLDPAKTLRQ